MRWLHFILSHSVFVAICAVALCYQTNVLLHITSNLFVYSFIFFATLCSYNFYWLISKYAFSNKGSLYLFAKNNISYLLLFGIASAGMLWAVLHIHGAILWISIAVILTVLYSLPLWPFDFVKPLRKLGFFKTTLLAFTWAYVTVVIPAFAGGNAQLLQVLLLLTARFFFMLMLCTIFDMRDVQVDKIHSLRSLATDVSMYSLKVIMLLSFLLYMAAGVMVRYHFAGNLQLAAFAVTGLLVWYVYRRSFKKQGYIFYYFVVDGLMLFSAAFTFIAEMIKNG